MIGVGDIEIDPGDGEICFRAAMDLRYAELTDGMVDCVLRVGLSTMDRFAPAIMSVITNDLPPEDVIALAAGGSQD